MEHIYEVSEDKGNHCFRFKLQPGKYKIYWEATPPTEDDANYKLKLIEAVSGKVIIPTINSDNKSPQSFEINDTDKVEEYFLYVKQYILSSSKIQHERTSKHTAESGQVVSIATSGLSHNGDFLFQLPNSIIDIKVEKDNLDK